MSNFFSFFKKKEHYLILGVLLLAAFLRLYKIRDYLTFLGDEGRDVLVVYGILHGHFTLLGPTSSVGGFFLGPVYYYMIAPFLWLFHYDPVGPAVMVALLGVATVWLVYQLGSEFFGKRVGFVASLLYAVSPLVIEYSRSSWNPNVVPFFTVLTLYFLYKGVISWDLNRSIWKNVRWFILSGFLFGIMMQLHYLATFVGAIIILYVFLSYCCFWYFQKKRIRFVFFVWNIVQQYMSILIGFLAGFSPYIAFEARHGFPNTKSILTFIFHSKDVSSGGNYFNIIGDVFFRLFGRLVTAYPPPEQFTWYSKPVLSVWFFVTLFLSLVSFGYFIWRFLQVFYRSTSIRDTKKYSYLLLFLWFGIGVLLFGFYKKNIYDYYFTFLFPVPFLFVGASLCLLWRQKLYGKVLSGILLLILFTVSLLGGPFRYPANRQLQQAEDISQFVLSKTNGQPFNFALITGGNSDHAYRYFFTIWGHPSTIINNPIDDPSRTSVTNQLLVVCESLPCSPLGNSLFEVAGFGRAEIVGHWSISVVEVYKLRHYISNNPGNK